MKLDITLCKTIKEQKSMSFLGPEIWNKLSSNIKTVATTYSFTHRLKKELLSKLQERAILLIFMIIIITKIFLFSFFKIIFNYISLRSYLYGDPNENRNRFRIFFRSFLSSSI